MATVLKTFTGESAIEALKKAKEECGESAMLVTTKQIQPKTLNKKPIYEILVSVEDTQKAAPSKESIESIKQQISAYTKLPESPKSDESVLLNISKAAKEISKAANINTNQNTNVSANEEYNKKIEDVAKQVNS